MSGKALLPSVYTRICPRRNYPQQWAQGDMRACRQRLECDALSIVRRIALRYTGGGFIDRLILTVHAITLSPLTISRGGRACHRELLANLSYHLSSVTIS